MNPLTQLELPNGMKMSLTYNVLCDLEKYIEGDIQEMFAAIDAGKVKLSDIRTLFWCALKVHQPKITIEEAGDVVQEYGYLLPKLVEVSNPQKGDVPDAGKSSRPKAVTTRK